MSTPNKVLIIDDLLRPDNLAVSIAEKYQTWENYRQDKVDEWNEIQRYIFATDTTHTTNAKLPWSNKTTVPKLAQIRDNLHANYMASMFPRNKWLVWEGDTESDEDIQKREAIQNYMFWATSRNEFLNEASRLVLDYIDYGNAIATVDWQDLTHEIESNTNAKKKVGYRGPRIRRISPLDIVFDPTAPDFDSSPKIIRSWLNMGEIKELLDRQSIDEETGESAREIWTYINEVRREVSEWAGNLEVRSGHYQIAGFGSYTDYLQSGTVEVLTFYGDIYDEHNETYLRNQVIKIIDRHKIIYHKPNNSFFGQPPIFHVGWRDRPDNLWSMGPLDNLIGMQYRIDHLENMKSDIMDLMAYPLLKIKGYVEDFVWQPFERIYVGDDGDVSLINPDAQALQYNAEIEALERKMEEMAGSPKEAMGIRSPGEKTAFEVQTLDNARSRIFQNKIALFERQMVERLLNAMLESATRNMEPTEVRIFDDENKIAVFKTLTVEDITGIGRIRPIAARHFAEKATKVQNLNAFLNGPGAAPDVRVHLSGLALARMYEELLGLENEGLVTPYVAISEQADGQRIAQSTEEEVAMEAQTPSGLTPDDFDEDLLGEEDIIPDEEELANSVDI